MHSIILPVLLLCCAPAEAAPLWRGGSYLCQPAYALDNVVRVPTEPYAPQPGDIFVATAQQYWSRAGHWMAGGAGLHHSGIVFMQSSGKPALVEAGPFNSLKIEILDACTHMHNHLAAGDSVWVRRRRVPLSAEQSACLTAFVEAQVGKRFALWRMLSQATPLRPRNSLAIYFTGRAHGTRDSYFCSELVMESCCAAGLVDPWTARPACTYPRELFFGKSSNWYLDKHLDLNDGWWPPARWLECTHK